LEGLDIEGLETSLGGVRILSAKRVTIRNSWIRGFGAGTTLANPNGGVVVVPSTNPVQVIIANSLISKSVNGVVVKPTGAVVANVHLNGVIIEGNLSADTVNAGFGVRVDGTNATVVMNDVVVRGNQTGLSVGAAGSTIESFKTNVIKGNFTANGVPTVSTDRQ
jgi:hypothetical protein